MNLGEVKPEFIPLKDPQSLIRVDLLSIHDILMHKQCRLILCPVQLKDVEVPECEAFRFPTFDPLIFLDALLLNQCEFNLSSLVHSGLEPLFLRQIALSYL